TIICRGAGVTANLSDIDVEPAQGRIVGRVSCQSDLQPGGEDCLTVGRGNCAVILYIRADKRHPSADVIGVGRAGDLSAGLNNYITVISARRIRRWWCKRWSSICSGRDR